ncbi:hypothetical protein NHX12_017571 [Muraenolepis orangiensis]|uniref:Uncharacterized protein n=1 Tax=Muraenolepis orangiensis TaxID=630683 RepID=A0A9Q0EV49_9TELE|nr:hypothetical protein NHX12_017571 [Muraenolepis orangiensis]
MEERWGKDGGRYGGEMGFPTHPDETSEGLEQTVTFLPCEAGDEGDMWGRQSAPSGARPGIPSGPVSGIERTQLPAVRLGPAGQECKDPGYREAFWGDLSSESQAALAETLFDFQAVKTDDHSRCFPSDPRKIQPCP